MHTLANILIDIINFFGTLYVSMILFRFLFQVVRADYYNPISKALVKYTNPLLIPMRKIIPGLFGVDIAALVLALLLQAILMFITLSLYGFSASNPLLYLPWAAMALLRFLITFYFYGVIVMIIASWVAPHSYNPALTLLNQLLEPVMAPFRKILPPMGGLDLSPMLFTFVLMMIRRYFLPILDQLFGTPGVLILGL